MSDNDLNNVVHLLADAIEKCAPRIVLDRYKLNALLTDYLQSLGVRFTEEAS